MSIEFKGTDALIGALKEKATMDDVKNVVRMNGSEMQNKSMRLAPVDTGFMKRSIGITVEDGGFTVRVGSTAQYAPFVNFGTRFQPSQPFLTSSFYEQRNKFMNDMKRLME